MEGEQKPRFIFGGLGLAAAGAALGGLFGGKRELPSQDGQKPRFLGGIINSISGLFRGRELAKIERHARQRGNVSNKCNDL